MMIRAASSFLRAASLATALALPNIGCSSIELRGGTIHILPGPFIWVTPSRAAEPAPHPSEVKKRQEPNPD